MRNVIVYKYERKDGNINYDKVENGTALFHRWGSSYEEFDNGASSFSTAIIERPDGTVENVPAEMIKFCAA